MKYDFVTGMLRKNIPDAIYEEQVFERMLHLECSDGLIREIFDGMFTLSDDLSTNSELQLIITPDVISGLQLVVTPDSHQISTKWVAIVEAVGDEIDGSGICIRAGKYDFHPNEWILVSTKIGNLLLGLYWLKDELGLIPKKGDCLIWADCRLDLFAICC